MAGAIPHLAPVVNAVSSYLVDPIAHQFKHLFFLSNNVKAMTDAMDELRAKRESIKQDIQIAELEGKTCSPEVALWLQNVDAFDQSKVADIKKAFDQRTNCIAMPSLNIVSNYKLGRRAFKKKKEMVQLLDKAMKFDILAKRLPPSPSRELATPSMVLNENSNLEMAYKYLKENTTGIIGICGMGGVGKTTLLRKINNEFYSSKDRIFDHVIWVVVSQQYSYEKIRIDIAKKLGLPIADADADPNAIHVFLKNKSFLLLLDDLWNELDLEKIGVPHDYQMHKRMMVVFTTRSEKVCAFMGAKKKIKMECLGPDASWLLFKEKAGEDLIASDELIEYHAMDIVKECAGLPLALVIVGKTMSTKKTPQEWEYVATMMRKSKYQSIPGMEESNFFPILKISYDSLTTEALRQCFLFCSSWGEDAEIDTDDLIERWMGHGLLDDFAYFGEAYNKGFTIIGILQEACLLELVDPHPWREHKSYVKLHDVIKDLALWITSDCGKNKKQGWLVDPNPSLLTLHEDAIDSEVMVINFSHDNIRRALDGFPQCHKLKTLIISTDWARSLTLTVEFIAKIRYLKYLDLSYNSIDYLPEEIGGLTGLEYLKLQVDLGSLPMALGDLKKLKYLYFVQSDMLENIPYGLIGRLTKLRVLDLYKTSFFLEGGHVDELLSLIELKGVGIRIKRFSTLERLVYIAKKRLLVNDIEHESDSITSFSISPSQLGSNSKANLHKFKIFNFKSLQELVMTTEGDNSWCLSHLSSLKIHTLPQLKYVIWKDLETRLFLPRLALLDISNCDSLTSLCWTAHLPRLITLRVSFCDNLKSIIKAGDHAAVIEEGNLFKSLQTLVLDYNKKLECIYEGELSLPSIVSIFLNLCSKLRKLPLGLDSAKNLKHIYVTSNMWNDMDWAHKDHFSHLAWLPFK